MKLKTRVVLVSALIVAAFWGAAEVLSYRQATEFLAQHELRIQQGWASDALLADLRQGRRSLLRELAAQRTLSALGAVAALSVALSLLWGRLLSQPVDLLLDRMNAMSRGTWTRPITSERDDEIGRLIREFNLLGPRLTFTAHQFAAASKLASMALISQQVTRRANLSRSRLVEARESLAEARYRGLVAPQTAMRQVEEVAEELADLAEDLDSGFNAELARQGLPPQSSGHEVGGDSRADSRRDRLIAR